MSSNLNAPALVGGQVNPETTANDAIGALDAALTELTVVDLTNSVSMSAVTYRGAFRFSLTPAGVAKTLTLPAVKRFAFISNEGANSVSIVRGSTSIALAAGTNALFYTDGATNGLMQIGATATLPNDLHIFISGKPTASAVVFRMKVVRAFTLPASLTGSNFSAGTASAATATFTIKNNGSSIGTVAFSTSATGTPTFASPVTFAINDVLTIESPVTQDTTLADVALNFLGTR